MRDLSEVVADFVVEKRGGVFFDTAALMRALIEASVRTVGLSPQDAALALHAGIVGAREADAALEQKREPPRSARR